nr:hypothetical protein CFP56_68276 [Quercus suber]
MLTSPIAKSVPQCPASPTFSLELITSIDGGSKPKGKYKALSGESFYILRKYLDYEEKYVKAKSKVESLSAENESLKGQISVLADKAKKDKEGLKTLENSINTEKALSKLKDKQINEALLMVKKASLEVVEKFKASDEYSDKICDYYVEGFDLLRKYLVKHHPKLATASTFSLNLFGN